jgi:hypothetical protein
MERGAPKTGPLRRILHEGGISWQATKTWKASHDPEFLPKVRRVLGLYMTIRPRRAGGGRGQVRAAEPEATQGQSVAAASCP